MARLNAKWYDFWQRGQVWYHFWQDTTSTTTVSGSFTADAVIRATISASFTANAVIKRNQTGSLTADAYITASRAGSFTADAVLLRNISASLTADAVLRVARSGSFSADAIIKRTQSASFTADAVIRKTTSSSFTANAVLLRAQSAAFTANAIVRRTQSAAFTADAVVAAAGSIFGSFTANAVLKKNVSSSFTASAWIYHPRADPDGPGEPGETPLVSIIVAGEDITEHVVIQDATFTMLVNGAIGTCSLRVRDDDHTRTFISGSEITVDIDGKRRFGGYILSPKRLLTFPVEDTTDPTKPTRFHNLVGVDYNILLTRRIVRNKSNPAAMELRSWPAGSHDDVIIKYAFDNYTDLPADGVTYNGVTHIGSPNPDKTGVVGSGSLRFLDLLQEVNRLISGVFYINAYKDLNYVDVDTPTSIYTLTDHPFSGGSLITTIEDDFNRVEVSGWGTGGLGAWTTGSGYSVDGAEGLKGTGFLDNAQVTPPAGTFLDPFTVAMRFKWPDTGSGNAAAVHLTVLDDFPSGFDYYIFAEASWSRFSNPTQLSLDLYWQATNPVFDENIVLIAGGSDLLAGGDLYANIKVRYDPVSQQVMTKYWIDTDVEPDWQNTLSGVSGDLVGQLNELAPGISVSAHSNPYRVDSISIATGADDVVPDNAVGYREFTRTRNGTGLVNDAMVWGAGQGSSRMVFSRAQDTDSITAHGLWQFGEFTSALFRQASTDLRADTIVNGTPQSKRGGKDDQVSWRVITWHDTFEAGQKVAIQSRVFDVEDIVPIRRLTLTFPTKQPKFELVLSHEIDEPWNLFEFWFPGFGGFPKFPKIGFDTGDGSLRSPDTCHSDQFNRSSAGSVSSDPDGPTWSISASPGGTDWGLNGSELFVGTSGGTLTIRTPDGPWDDGAPISRFLTRFRFIQPSGVFVNFPSFDCELRDGGSNNVGWNFQINGAGGGFSFHSNASSGVSVNYALPGGWSSIDYSAGDVWFRVRWEINTTTGAWKVKVWKEDDGEPAPWTIESTTPYEAGAFSGTIQSFVTLSSSFSTRAEYMDFLTACGVGSSAASNGSARDDDTGDGATTVFALPSGNGYYPGSMMIFVDGFYSVPGTDFTETDPVAGTVTFTTAPGAGSPISYFYQVARV